MNHYHTIEKPSFAELKERGSRFLAYAFPVQTPEEFKGRLKEIKEEHPKAAHHCFAYRLGTAGDAFRAGDDGEPAGTAGRPILGQIDSKSLVNVAVVVVRYFGGTLLGVPGLIHAYKTAASLALQLTPILQKPVLALYQLHFDYTRMNDVMVVLKRFNCVIVKKEEQLFCRMVIGIPKDVLEDCLEKWKDLHGVEVSAAS